MTFFKSYLDISAWEFFSPSTVKGDAPVSSSYIRTPKLHQSTAYKTIIIHFVESANKMCHKKRRPK